MPYLGLFPFLLHLIRLYQVLKNQLFQCPISGYSHFYSGHKHVNHHELLFQCPISGYSHFYISQYLVTGRSCWFQCPISGYSHFYALLICLSISSWNCFNALSRAIPISTTTVESALTKKENIVSMPYLGLFPFLRYALQRRINSAFREPFLRVIHRIF